MSGLRYEACDDGEIDCPACGEHFAIETWEDQIGSTAECKACGIELEVTDIDYSRTLYWSPVVDVRWSAWCRMWREIGSRIHFEKMYAERQTAGVMTEREAAMVTNAAIKAWRP